MVNIISNLMTELDIVQTAVAIDVIIWWSMTKHTKSSGSSLKNYIKVTLEDILIVNKQT
jgi:hypothetical protein